jgi:parvulin-like peptidyl-prolyl isomerase
MAMIVNGERIEDARIQEEVERLRPAYEKAFPDKPPKDREAEMLEWSQDNLIERVLFQRELKNDKRPVPPEIVNAVYDKMQKSYTSLEEMLKAFGTDEQGMHSIIAQFTKERLRIREIGDRAPAPSGAQVREYYERNQEKYVLGEQVRVVHIVKRLDGSSDATAALDALTTASAEIHAGKPFETISAKYAGVIDDVEDLGYIYRGQMPDEFDDIVFNLGPGQVSHVFRTRLGLHVAKVYERRPPRTPPLQDIRQRVINDLTEQLREDAFAAHLDELRRAAVIEYV